MVVTGRWDIELRCCQLLVHILFSVVNNEKDNGRDINNGNCVDKYNQNDGGDADYDTRVQNIPITITMIVYTNIFHAFWET